MPKSKLKPKASPRSAKAKAKRVNSGPQASEEFGGELYASDDWKNLKKKHPGGFQATLVDLEKKDWDDGSSWYAVLEGHDKLAKVSRPSGRALAEVGATQASNSPVLRRRGENHLCQIWLCLACRG